MSRNRFHYDAENVLRAFGSAAVTATGASDSKELARPTVRGAHPGIAYTDLAVVVDVDAVGTTDGDETYELSVEVDTDASFASPVKVHGAPVAKTGRYAFILDGDTVELLEPGTRFVRVKATLAGTTPSLAYSAFLAANRN